jgi:antitoxin (DNA-binding transcriptional repressor) of toxin-antitoxin stability system
MRTITHCEMRDRSDEILGLVADGETIMVTEHGEPVALILPPGRDPLADLAASGQVHPARRPLSSLRSIARRRGEARSEEIVADARGLR